jgi:hypothetical protein
MNKIRRPGNGRIIHDEGLSSPFNLEEPLSEYSTTIAIEPHPIFEPVRPARGAQWLESESTLELSLIYEEARTQTWTGQVTESLAEAMGKDAVHAAGWRIADLNQPGAFAEAVGATTERM